MTYMSQTLDSLTGGYGGIGRRAGFRFQWETVQVQVLLSAVNFKSVWKQGLIRSNVLFSVYRDGSA